MICPNCGFDNVPGEESCSQCQQDLTHLDLAAPIEPIGTRLLNDSVQDLQPPKPILMPSDASIQEALNQLSKHRIGAVLIVDEQQKLLGILSERDITMRVAGLYVHMDQLKVADFMTPNPETVNLTDPLVFALHKMDVGDYRHLPVVDKGIPVGMISVRGLLAYMTRHLNGHAAH